MRRLPRRLALLLLATAAADQIVLFTVLGDDRLAGLLIAPFDPPVFSRGQAGRIREIERLARGDGAASESIFDVDLGWCPRPGPADPPYSYDAVGGRLTDPPFSAERMPDTRRVGAFGCSFTRADEVEGAEGWAARLHARPGYEVSNLGMGGYGADQALLRFRRDAPALDLDEVWLAWMPASALRVVTQYPPLLNHWTNAVAFKPRFVLGPSDELELRPSPVSTAADFGRLMSDQAELLAAIGSTDRWIARAPRAYAPRGTSWTHRFATTRALLTWHERRGRNPGAEIADSESEVHRLHLAIVRGMATEAREAGLRFRFLVLPAHPDLEGAAGGDAYWGALTSTLVDDGIEVLDLTAALEEAGARSDPTFWMPGGHYAPKAHAVVARELTD